jgi:hypothetical protein
VETATTIPFVVVRVCAFLTLKSNCCEEYYALLSSVCRYSSFERANRLLFGVSTITANSSAVDLGHVIIDGSIIIVLYNGRRRSAIVIIVIVVSIIAVHQATTRHLRKSSNRLRL